MPPVHAQAAPRRSFARRGARLALGLAVLLPACARPGALDTGGDRSASEFPAGGLEVRWWVVDDGWGALAPTLAGVSESVPLPEATAQLWAANGFRLIAVPVEHLEPVQHALPMVGPGRVQRLGPIAEWTEVLPGHRFRGGERLVLHGASFQAPRGRLRLLARAWARPTPGDASPGTLRLELAPQLAETPAPADDPGTRAEFWTRRLVERPITPTWARGISFDGLRAEFDARPGVAYLLVGESPDADWASLPPPIPPPTIEQQQRALRALREPPGPDDEPLPEPALVPDAPDARTPEDLGVFGPSPGSPPTLGEAMLREPDEHGRPGIGPRTVVLVLIPYAPERFELLRATGR